jgi:hypothetical protein
LAALLLALSACLLAPALARAKQPPPPAPTPCAPVFSTPNTPVALAWREKSERRIEVLPAVGKEPKLRARLGDFAMTDADGKKLTITDFIKVEPETATVTDAGVQLLISVERTTAVRPGVYLGSLTLSEEGTGTKGCALRLSVQVTVADAAPLSDKLMLHAYRLVPFTSLWTCGECALPLRGPLEPKTTALRNDVPLGGVQNKDGGTVAVYWTGGPSVSADGLTLMPVSLRGLGGAGQYEGQLRLGPAADASPSVNLTLDASDIVLWPILTIAFSTWLGLRAQRYLNVMRTIWRLREEEAALGVAFAESSRRFDEAAGDSTFASYSIAEDLERRRGELRQKIGALQSRTTLTLDTASAPYKAVLDDFQALREAVAAWARFADELAALRDATEGQDAGEPPQGYEDSTPALMAWAEGLLSGGALTLGAFAEREKQVRDAVAAVNLWFTLRNRIAEYRQSAERLRAVADDMTEEQRTSLDAAESNLRTAELRLWQADSPAALEAVKASGGELDTAETALRQLAANVSVASPGAQPPSVAGAHAASLGALKGAFARWSAAARELVDDRERQLFYANAIRRWDVALTLLAFLIATLTALYNNYFGKSFGSLRDYVGLLILGLGTKIAVDTASAALGWLFGGGAGQRPQRRA